MLRSPEQIIKQVDTLKGERGTWENHWQELANFILPRKNTITRTRVAGEKTNQFLLDNTAMQSNVLLAGFLHGLLTNPNDQFFQLTTGNDDIDDRDDVRLWLQDSAKKMLHILNNSNFQTEIHELYIDLGCFGTSCMDMEEDPDTVIRFSTRPLESCFIEEDNKGRIIELHRRFEWNINKIIQQFGEDVVRESRILERAFANGSLDKFKIIHSVYPKDIVQDKPINSFISQYVLEPEKLNLKVSGFREFPHAVPRWTKHSGEKYGRSAGMVALSECKTLNLMVETTIKGAQKTIDPPLQAPDDGYIGTIRTRPGSINFFRGGSSPQDRISPIFNDARIDFGFQANEEKRQRIREAFFTDQLRLREGGPQMTATEVEARMEQAFRFMGPVIGRQQSELLRPIIDRVFGIMERRGMIDPAPDILRDRKIDVQYSSVIARAQKQGTAKAILRTIEQIAPFVSADPSILDNIDGDKALRVLARVNDFPQAILRNQREVIKLRKDRADQENLEQDEALKSNTAENISKVSPALQAVASQG